MLQAASWLWFLWCSFPCSFVPAEFGCILEWIWKTTWERGAQVVQTLVALGQITGCFIADHHSIATWLKRSLPASPNGAALPSLWLTLCMATLVLFVLSRRIRPKLNLPTLRGCRDVLTLVVLRSITTFQATMFPPPATRYGQLCHWICLNNFTGSQTFGFWSSPFCKCCRSRSPQQHLGLLWCRWSESFLWHSAKMLMKT